MKEEIKDKDEFLDNDIEEKQEEKQKEQTLQNR